MTAQQFREALGATLPLTDWTDNMLRKRARARRAVTATSVTGSLHGTVWYLGPENEPRRWSGEVAA